MKDLVTEIAKAKPAAVTLDHERIAHWMKNGAQPSGTVARLLKTSPAAAEFTPADSVSAPDRAASDTAAIAGIQRKKDQGGLFFDR